MYSPVLHTCSGGSGSRDVCVCYEMGALRPANGTWGVIDMRRMSVIVAMCLVILLCLACSPVLANESGVVNGLAGSENITGVINAEVVSGPPGIPETPPVLTNPDPRTRAELGDPYNPSPSIPSAETGSTSGSESYVFVTKWGSQGSGDGQFNNPHGVAVDSSGNVYVIETHPNDRIQKFSSDGTFITKWGSYGSGDGQFIYPYGVAVDSSGNVYVADGDNHRIQKISSDGTFITKWGSYGSGDGQFIYPTDVAVDSSGNVYVADYSNNRIQKFTSTGTFITKWGAGGSGDGQFKELWNLAVDSSGDVYVADLGNNRIQKFTSTGTFITKWGAGGSGDGQFQYPSCVAVDSSDNVYVVDMYNHRIQKFSSSGSFITKWGSSGSGDGQFQYPRGITVDSSGNVYVADRYNYRIQKFAPSPANPPVAAFTGLPTSGTAPLNVTYTDNSTNMPTSWWWNFGDGYYSTDQNPVHTYSGTSTYTDSDNIIAIQNMAFTPPSMTVNKGAIVRWVNTDAVAHTVTFTTESGIRSSGPLSSSQGFSVKFDQPGVYEYTCSIHPSIHGTVVIESTSTYTVSLTATNSAGSNTFSRTNYITVSSGVITPVANFTGTPTSGTSPLTVTFTDSSTNTPTSWSWSFGDGSSVNTTQRNPVHTYTSAGTYTVSLTATNSAGSNTFTRTNYIAVGSTSETYVFVTKWGTEGTADGQFKYPYGVAVDSSGNVYIADTYNSRIQKFDTTGSFIAKWESAGYSDVQFYYPTGVAVDSSDNVYVDANTRIQKFSSNGTFLLKWGTAGTGNGQFWYPRDIAVDSSGNVYVADSGNYRIQKFSSTGSFLTKWGSGGSSDGKFYEPRGIAVDPSGNVYVADNGNNRIQKFNSTGSFLTKWGSLGSGDGQFNYPEGIAVDSSGNVYVADRDNYRIQKFNSTGTFLTKWGTEGTGDGQFWYPSGVAVDSSGIVYVADNENNRIQKFARESALAANFTATPTSGAAPLTVRFTDSSTGTPTNWNWSFGDGSSVNSTMQNPVHTYSSAGTYTISLTATNSVGSNTFTRTNYITVSSAVVVPVASFTGTPTSGTAPLTVTFTDSSTNTPTSWSWNFGDSSSVNATSQNPVHPYASAGTYTVALTATNSAGSNTLTRTSYITVSSAVVTPVANFAGTPTSGTAPLTVKFTDSSTNTPTSWTWNFGDGTYSTEKNPSHIYTNASTYTVKLTATNSAGSNTFTRTNYIVATQSVLTLSSIFPTSGIRGTTVFISNLAGSNFQSGTTVTFTNSKGSVSATNVIVVSSGKITCNFEIPNQGWATGSWDVTVTNPDGQTATLTNGFTAITTAPLPVNAIFTGSPTTGNKPLPVQFTDASTGPVTAWSWTFGDGNTSTLQNPLYTYPTAGIFTVSLTVNNGTSTHALTKTSYITVTSPAALPTLSFQPGTATVPVGSTTTYAIKLDTAAKGLSGYNITIASSNPSIGKIVGVTYPSWASMAVNSTMPSGSAWFKAVDLTGVSGTTNITLCTVTIRGDTEGTTTLAITSDKIEDRTGGQYSATLTSAQFVVGNSSVKPFPKPGGGYFPAPTDPNLDGKYEDLDGNGWIGFNDVLLFYTYMESIDTGAYGPVSYFDYDGSGFIGFNDVVWLYNMA